MNEGIPSEVIEASRGAREMFRKTYAEATLFIAPVLNDRVLVGTADTFLASMRAWRVSRAAGVRGLRRLLYPSTEDTMLRQFLARLFRVDSDPRAKIPADGKLTYEQVTQPRA